MRARWISVPAVSLMAIGVGSAMSSGAPTAAVQNVEVQTAEVLAATNGCFDCHGVDEQAIGPAFRDVAARYRNDDRARAALIETLGKGGKGNWTEISRGVPMPPFSGRLSEAEIGRLVDWVLGLPGRDTLRVPEVVR